MRKIADIEDVFFIFLGKITIILCINDEHLATMSSDVKRRSNILEYKQQTTNFNFNFEGLPVLCYKPKTGCITTSNNFKNIKHHWNESPYKVIGPKCKTNAANWYLPKEVLRTTSQKTQEHHDFNHNKPKCGFYHKSKFTAASKVIAVFYCVLFCIFRYFYM